MRTTRSRMFATTVLVVILASIAAGATMANGLSPSASVTTTIQGWERWLNLEWTAEARASGQAIDGYVYNTYGQPAGNVRLLAQALDAGNTVVAQKIEWVPGIVPNFNRSYFKISPLPPADHYRVSVWSFDIIDTGSRRRF